MVGMRSSISRVTIISAIFLSVEPAIARCQIPWVNPSPAAAASYLLDNADVVALARLGPSKDSNNEAASVTATLILVRSSLLSSGFKPGQQLSVVRVSRRLIEAAANGDLILVAGHVSKTGSGIVLHDNQCFGLAIDAVGEDKLISQLFTR